MLKKLSSKSQEEPEHPTATEPRCTHRNAGEKTLLLTQATASSPCTSGRSCLVVPLRSRFCFQPEWSHCQMLRMQPVQPATTGHPSPLPQAKPATVGTSTTSSPPALSHGHAPAPAAGSASPPWSPAGVAQGHRCVLGWSTMLLPSALSHLFPVHKSLAAGVGVYPTSHPTYTPTPA